MRSSRSSWGCGWLLAMTMGALALPAPAAADEILAGPPRAAAQDISLIDPTQFVVVFKREAAHAMHASLRPDGSPSVNSQAVQRLIDLHGITALEREFVSAQPQAVNSRFPELTGHYLVSLPQGTDLQHVMAEWAAEPDVDHVEPIGIHSVDLTPNDTYWIYGTPTFPYDQWHYWDTWGIDADLAWDTETGDPSAVVAILDTGVKYRHTDLGGADPPGPADNVTAGNIWVNPFEIPGNGIDDEGNGFIDDVVGWDFVSAGIVGTTCTGFDVDCGITENDPNDGEGHGTFCSGIVAGITNNARGGAGTAGGFSNGTTSGPGNGVKVMPMRIGHRAQVVVPPTIVTGVVNMAWCAQAMNYVADMKSRGVNIVAVNCSWGSSNSGGISAAVDNLLANDVMVISAAGNSNSSSAPFLATKAGVIAVGASDSTGLGASFSNFGPWVDFAAPGVGIFSTTHVPTDPDTTHMYISVGDGTSYSAPMTCGVAALLESYNPALTATDKANILASTTIPFNPANTKQLGTGIINARNALNAAPPPVAVGDAPAFRGRFALRAFPNPTRAGSTLELSAPMGTTARFSVLDVHGRLVRDLGSVDSRHVSWDGTDALGHRVPMGLYFAVAEAGGARTAKRLIVME